MWIKVDKRDYEPSYGVFLFPSSSLDFVVFKSQWKKNW